MSRSRFPKCPRGRGCGVCRDNGQSRHRREAVIEKEELRDANAFIAELPKREPSPCFWHRQGVEVCDGCLVPCGERKSREGHNHYHGLST